MYVRLSEKSLTAEQYQLKDYFMIDLDRIEYTGFSKEYTKQRMSMVLAISAVDIESLPIDMQPGKITSEQARIKILKDKKGISRLVIRVAYLFKGIIRHIPFLGKIAILIKSRMLAKAQD